jgi:hypothetical protein
MDLGLLALGAVLGLLSTVTIALGGRAAGSPGIGGAARRARRRPRFVREPQSPGDIPAP